MSSNQEALAQIRALQAIDRARSPRWIDPMLRAMQALEEAIHERRCHLVDLAQRGQAGTPEYRKTERQMKTWDATWQSNR